MFTLQVPTLVVRGEFDTMTEEVRMGTCAYGNVFAWDISQYNTHTEGGIGGVQCACACMRACARTVVVQGAPTLITAMHRPAPTRISSMRVCSYHVDAAT